jgi:hypothetical protein
MVADEGSTTLDCLSSLTIVAGDACSISSARGSKDVMGLNSVDSEAAEASEVVDCNGISMEKEVDDVKPAVAVDCGGRGKVASMVDKSAAAAMVGLCCIVEPSPPAITLAVTVAAAAKMSSMSEEKEWRLEGRRLSLLLIFGNVERKIGHVDCQHPSY